jgi:predicted nucleotidyltransferase
MENNDILKSFEPKDELNPKIWEKTGDEYKIRDEVRQKLLETSNIFIDFLGVDVVITDIIMIGSLVNYNWSKYSDIDLHIVVNFNQFPENSKDLYLEFFDLKKVIFNQKHNIKMFGYDVECFVQKEDETTFSSGIYSILYDMWMNEPKKLNKETIEVIIMAYCCVMKKN